MSNLDSYLFDTPSETPINQLRQSFSYINTSLASFGYPILGDLFTTNPIEIRRTIDCIHTILQQKQRDLNLRVQFQERIQKLTVERNNLQRKLDLLNQNKQKAQNQIGKFQNRLKQQTDKFRQERQKLVSERDDFRKQCNKLIGRETQIWHEMKKKDQTIERMKEQLRKALGEKDWLYMNHIDLTEPLHLEGPKMFGQTGESEFNFVVTRGYQENQNALLAENQELRSAFEVLQRELNNIMRERKALLQTSSLDLAQLEMIDIAPQIFNLPFQSVSEDVVKTFQENLRRFKVFLEGTTRLEAGL